MQNIIVFLSLLVGSASADQVSKLPKCSASRTNETCKLVVDRRSPLSPSTLQLYSGQHIVVIVKGALWTERYFLDYGPGQATLRPEVGTLLAQSLIAPLGKLQISLDKSIEDALLNVSRSIQSLNGSLKQLMFQNKMLFDKRLGAKPEAKSEELLESGSGAGSSEPARPSPPPRAPVVGVPWRECDGVFAATMPPTADVLATTRACVAAMSRRAIELYAALEPLSSPDTVVGAATTTVVAPSVSQLQLLQAELEEFVAAEAKVSAQLGILSRVEKPPLDLATLFGRLATYQKFIDTIAGDLLGYSQRLEDLGARPHPTFQPCTDFGVKGESAATCAVLAGRPGPDDSLPEPSTRSVTYSINVLNLISNPQEAATDSSKRRALASVVVSFGGNKGHFYDIFDSTRWDGSIGLLFSALPNRTFSVAPVFMNGTVIDNRVNETRSLPTPVPFIAVNYRLTNDLPLSTWKTNLYVSGLAGINPNTTTTDFGAGLSVSWRSLMLSVMAHFAHDMELAQGLTVNQSLGSTFNAPLPTHAFWTTTIAIGISVRVPSLTGR